MFFFSLFAVVEASRLFQGFRGNLTETLVNVSDLRLPTL